MKSVIENTIKHFFEAYKNKQLLSDLDDLDNDVNNIENIASKSINTKITDKDIIIQYLNDLANGNIWDVQNDIRAIRLINEINNPKNYIKYAAVVPVATTE